MKFNYGLEKKKFEKEWENLREEYTKAGMSEEAIQEMYEYDLKNFRRRRIISIHEQSFDGLLDSNEEEVLEDRNPLMTKYFDNLSVNDEYSFDDGRFSWIEKINNHSLYEKLCSLSDEDKELLTMLVVDELSKRNIAFIRNISEQAVGQKLKRLKKYLLGV